MTVLEKLDIERKKAYEAKDWRLERRIMDEIIAIMKAECEPVGNYSEFDKRR